MTWLIQKNPSLKTQRPAKKNNGIEFTKFEFEQMQHFADAFSIKITNKEVNTITLIYEQVRWNFDLNSQVKIRYNKKIPEVNQIYYKIDDLQHVWGVPNI